MKKKAPKEFYTCLKTGKRRRLPKGFKEKDIKSPPPRKPFDKESPEIKKLLKGLAAADFKVIKEHKGGFLIQPPNKKQKPFWLQPSALDGERRFLPPDGTRDRDIKRFQAAEAKRWDRHIKNFFELPEHIRKKHPGLLGDIRKAQRLSYDTFKRPLLKDKKD